MKAEGHGVLGAHLAERVDRGRGCWWFVGRRRRLLGTAIVVALATVCLLSLTASPALAIQPPTRAAVQRAIQRMVKYGAPGVAAVIQTPAGQETFSAGYGDLRGGTRISPRDHFRVGSVAKTFTAAVVLKLVARGQIGLGDTVQKWLPGLVPNGAHITVRELLNQSSGLADYCAVPPDSTLCSPPLRELARRWTPRELVKIGAGAKPTFPPGQGWAYSNTNYVLLGMIVQHATGRSFGAVLRSEILRPLHLDHTGYPSGTAMPRPYSHGYDVMAGLTWPVDLTGQSPTIAWSSGAVVSTPGDLDKFFRALMSGRVIPPKLLREMKRATPGSLNGPHALLGGGTGAYGLGLVHYTWSFGCGAWGHLGDFPGFHTMAIVSGDGQRAAAMYINSDEFSLPRLTARFQAERLLACRTRFLRVHR
jgi:D-alanyl-D-alanine carboxypeptidase